MAANNHRCRKRIWSGGGGGGGQGQVHTRGVWGHAPPEIFLFYNP